jgi:hypothetical protein
MPWLRRFVLATGSLVLALQWSAGCSDSGTSKGDATVDGVAGDGGGEGKDSEGLAMCCELGAICHEVGPQQADRAECHELGHLNDPSECRANYERCMDICGHSGEGGQAGAPETHACVD